MPSRNLYLIFSASEYEHEVQGLLFTLTAKDEEALDRAEGVPYSYQKHLRWIYIPSGGEDEEWKRVLALVYIDSVRVTGGICKGEYVARMNRGIRYALKLCCFCLLSFVSRREEQRAKEEGFAGTVF